MQVIYTKLNATAALTIEMKKLLKEKLVQGKFELLIKLYYLIYFIFSMQSAQTQLWIHKWLQF